MIEMELAVIATTLFKVGLAFLLVLPSALDRELSTLGIGLHTFPLVAVARCGTCWSRFRWPATVPTPRSAPTIPPPCGLAAQR